MGKIVGGTTITFLGTGAADWPEMPEVTTGPGAAIEQRKWSAALMDDDVLIDCPRHVPDTLRLLGRDARAITDVLLTHTHPDHLDAEALRELAAGRAGTLAGTRGTGRGEASLAAVPAAAAALRIWGHADALERLSNIPGVEKRPVRVGELLSLPRFTAEPLAANHVVEGSAEQPLHYLLRGASVILYATDGAWLLRGTWNRLRGVRLDAVVMDATIGDAAEGDWRIFEHNSIDMIRLMRKTFAREGVVDAQTLIILTHMARTLHPAPSMARETLSAEGFIAAHDGLRVTVPARPESPAGPASG